MTLTENTGRAGKNIADRTVQHYSIRESEPPFLELKLWPHRSLSRSGFAVVMKLAAVGLAFPVVGTLGSPVGWMLLPFAGATLFALWWSIRKNNYEATLTETLRMWDDLIAVERREPSGTIQRWHANPYWVSTHIHSNAKVENYLTLKGNGREIELGAFLSPEERLGLRRDIDAAISKLRLERPEPGR